MESCLEAKATQQLLFLRRSSICNLDRRHVIHPNVAADGRKMSSVQKTLSPVLTVLYG